jgi:CRP/FNR family transcriptional regulator, anaerobic regulatory protein
MPGAEVSNNMQSISVQSIIGDDRPRAGIRELAPSRTLPSPLSWTRQSLAGGHTLYREGALANRAFRIRSGIVKLVAHLPNGRARILGLHGAAAVLGLTTPASASERHDHSAVAVTDAEVDWVTTAQLRRLRSQGSHEYLDLMERHCEGLKLADRWIIEFSMDTISQRITRVIKFLAELQGPATSRRVALLTCQEMAEIIGTSTESASRELAKLKRRGVLTAADSGSTRRLYRFDPRAVDNLAPV